MSDEQINIAIAEACGLDVIQNPHGSKDRPEAWKTGFFTPKAAKQRRISWPSSTIVKVIPDYLNDLNAMHEAEKVLFPKHEAKWAMIISEVCGHSWRIIYTATAAQRAEAFLRTLNLWSE
jgi:hypothetical protein